MPVDTSHDAASVFVDQSSRRAFPTVDRGSRYGSCYDRCCARHIRRRALLDFEIHESPGNVPEQLANDVVLSPLFNELGKCHTGLGHRGVLSRKVVSAKTTVAKSHDGRPLLCREPSSYTTPRDTISVQKWNTTYEYKAFDGYAFVGQPLGSA